MVEEGKGREVLKKLLVAASGITTSPDLDSFLGPRKYVRVYRPPQICSLDDEMDERSAAMAC